MIEDLLSRQPQTSIRLGLERITAACEALGRPQGRYPSVLIAGTNGKGSTAAFLSSILARTGRKVGLYTSPHLVDFRERIRIDGEAISPEELERAGARLLQAWPPFGEPGHPDALTYFEAATAMAFDVFARAGVDIAILEVGLGGRLDATNVPGTRLCAAVVTPIGLDHTEYLGDTLEAVAGEKAAIARAGIPLVTGAQRQEAMEVLRRRAQEVGAPLIVAPKLPIGLAMEEVPGDAPGGAGVASGPRLGLLGLHQVQNAALAVATLAVIRGTIETTEAMVREGLAAARWPGRMERVADSPLTILDGAHNADGARALAASLAALWPRRRFNLIFGVLADKDRGSILEALLPLAASLHLCPVASSRAVPASVVAAEAEALGAQVRTHASLGAALDAAREEAGEEGAVLVCGSLYLIGAARAILCGDPP